MMCKLYVITFENILDYKITVENRKINLYDR